MQKYVRFVVSVVLALLVPSITTLIMMVEQQLAYAPGPSACPDPSYCHCNAATGVMMDDKIEIPINNGCTEGPDWNGTQ
jgi:hypothetical protein